MTPSVHHSSSHSPPALLIFSTPWSSTQLASPFTPSQAIPSARLWYRARTMSRLPASSGTVRVLGWYSAVRNGSAGIGYLALRPRMSACPLSNDPLFRPKLNLDVDLTRSRILTHGDSQFTWTHGSASGHVSICSH